MAEGTFPNKELIRWIINTYDLPPSLKPKIISIAEQRIGELSLGSFDKQYRYISELIYKFTIPYSEKFALPLDAPINECSNTQFHEIIENKLQLLEEISEVSPSEAFDCLEKKLEEPHTKIISHLLKRSNGFVLEECFSKEILKNPEEIKKRLEILQKYGKKGKLILPPPHIYFIALNPLAKKFGQRRYNGNPLAFLKSHPEYENLTRDQLHKYDRALYVALHRTKQINQIPKGHSYHEFPTPLDFLKANPEYENITKEDLHKKNRALYVALRRANQLNLLPKKISSKNYRGFSNPLECFRVFYKDCKISRIDLFNKDKDLYRALIRTHQLNNAIPENYRGFLNPLDFFKFHSEYCLFTKSELRKENPGLYRALQRRGHLREAFPENYRGYQTPLDFFKANKLYQNITRAKLLEIDPELYDNLCRKKQINEAIPRGNYRGFNTPLDYFKKHKRYHNLTRGQLIKKDPGLYSALYKRGQLQEAIPK